MVSRKGSVDTDDTTTDENDHDTSLNTYDNDNEDQMAASIRWAIFRCIHRVVRRTLPNFQLYSKKNSQDESRRDIIHRSAIEKKYGKNADVTEGVQSADQKGIFRKILLLRCVCAGQTTRDASCKSERESCSRLTKCK